VAFYSRTAKELSAPLPEGWDANAVVGRAMSGDKAEAATVEVKDGKLVVKVQAERAVMVFRDAGAARVAN
jgi:hypothetical protein